MTTTALTEDCIHLLPLVSCRLCMDSLSARPVGTDLQRFNAGRTRVERKVPKNGVIRPMREGDPGFDPDDPAQQWTYDEWSAPAAKAARKATLSRLRSYERDRYDGRTCGPKDLSIKPINRTRR